MDSLMTVYLGLTNRAIAVVCHFFITRCINEVNSYDSIVAKYNLSSFRHVKIVIHEVIHDF